MFFQLGTVIWVWSHSPLKPDFCWEVPIEKRWSVYILKSTALQTTSWIIPFCYTHDYGRDIPGSRRQPAQNFWFLKKQYACCRGILVARAWQVALPSLSFQRQSRSRISNQTAVLLSLRAYFTGFCSAYRRKRSLIYELLLRIAR